jgi:hypothetical protein
MSHTRETFLKFLSSIEEGVIRAELKTRPGTGYEPGFARLCFRDSHAMDDEFRAIIDYLIHNRNQITKIDFIGTHKLTKKSAEYLDGVAKFVCTYQIGITGMDQGGHYKKENVVPYLIAHKYLDDYFNNNCQGYQFIEVENWKNTDEILLTFGRIAVKSTFRREYVKKDDNKLLEEKVKLLEEKIQSFENQIEIMKQIFHIINDQDEIKIEAQRLIASLKE